VSFAAGYGCHTLKNRAGDQGKRFARPSFGRSHHTKTTGLGYRRSSRPFKRRAFRSYGVATLLVAQVARSIACSGLPHEVVRRFKRKLRLPFASALRVVNTRALAKSSTMPAEDPLLIGVDPAPLPFQIWTEAPGMRPVTFTVTGPGHDPETADIGSALLAPFTLIAQSLFTPPISVMGA
jgi:hypothetical protein